MTLRIRAGKLRLYFKIPLCLAGAAVNRYVKKAKEKLPQENAVTVDKQAVKKVVKELRAAKKLHGKLEILSVESEDGTKIKLRL